MARSSNFTNEEINVLLSCLEGMKGLITNEGDYKTPSAQKKGWAQIANYVNSVGVEQNRTEKNIKNKWLDLKSRCKSRAAAIKSTMMMTGGGSPCNKKLSDIQERVLKLIGKTSVDGITGLEFDLSANQIHEARKIPNEKSSVPFSTNQNQEQIVETWMEESEDFGEDNSAGTPSENTRFIEKGDSNPLETPKVKTGGSWFLARKDVSYTRQKVDEFRKKKRKKEDDEELNLVTVMHEELINSIRILNESVQKLIQSSERGNEKMDLLLEVIKGHQK